jgi:hypothetical protein
MLYKAEERLQPQQTRTRHVRRLSIALESIVPLLSIFTLRQTNIGIIVASRYSRLIRYTHGRLLCVELQGSGYLS